MCELLLLYFEIFISAIRGNFYKYFMYDASKNLDFQFKSNFLNKLLI